MTESSVQNETIDIEANLSNADKANAEAKKYIYAAVAAGFWPTPLVEMAAITGVQLKMIHSISKIYDVSFSKEIVKSSIASLLGAISTRSMITAGLGSLLKAIPGVGTVAGALAVPTVAGAATYAVAKVFIKHYEAGGTLLNFNPDSMKEYFKEVYADGVNAVKGTVDEVKNQK